MQIRIPRSAVSRRARTWALLVRRISPLRGGRAIFEGTHFKTGELVAESDLRPTPKYPLVPLLIEYAGTTGLDLLGRPARGHNRSTDIHVLWRYEARAALKPGGLNQGAFREIARVTSQGPEWFQHFAPIVRREMVRPPSNFVEEARTASDRLVAALDRELYELDADEARERVLSFLYDQVAARLVAA